MSSIRKALLAAGLAAVVTATAACSADPKTEVETTFRDYYAALLARDFPAACALNAPESTAKLLQSLTTQRVIAATCEEAFTKIYAEPGPAETADGIARSAQITTVTVDGDTASITWSAVLDGEQTSVTNALRRIDGAWRLAAT